MRLAGNRFIDQPEFHWAQFGAMFGLVAIWRLGAAARDFRVFGIHVQLAIAHLGDDANVAVFLNANPRFHLGQAGVGLKFIDRRER